MTGAPVDLTLTPPRDGHMTIEIAEAAAKNGSWLVCPSTITEGRNFAVPGGALILSVSATLAPLGMISG